jgi:hypothetical protein
MTLAPRSALLCVLLLLAPPAFAGDDGFGVIMGTVLSPDERELLGGVIVTATSPALMGERNAVTDEDGFFWFPQLPPGRYLLSFYFERLPSITRRLTVRSNQRHLANVEMLHQCMSATIHDSKFPVSVPLGARRSPLSRVLEP